MGPADITTSYACRLMKIIIRQHSNSLYIIVFYLFSTCFNQVALHNFKSKRREVFVNILFVMFINVS